MIRKAFSAIILLCGLAACSQDLEGTLYRPNSDDGKEIHFSVSQMSKTFSENDKAGIIELSVVRPGTLGTHTVELAQMGSDEAIFSFPQSVTIPAGEYSTIVPVLVNLKNCVKGSSYSTSVYIVGRDQATGAYGAQNALYSDAVSISVDIELNWEPLMVSDGTPDGLVQQTATYTYNAFWTGYSSNLPVEKAVCEEKIYRISGWGSNEVKLMWMVNDDGTCILPKQNTGYFNSTYGQYIYVSDYPNNTNLSYTYKSYPCTWSEGTFSFNVIYYREGSTGSFGKGVETIVFDSMKPKTPKVSIEYLGADSTATGFVGAKVSFTPEDGTKSAYAAFFSAALDSAAIASAADELALGNEPAGAAKTFSIYGPETQSWALPYGPVTVVAVPFNEDGVRGETAKKVFTFDPEGTYSVQVRNFQMLNDPSDENHDPKKTLCVKLSTKNLVKGWYTIQSSSLIAGKVKNGTLEEYLTGRTAMTDAFVKSANGTSGRTWYYTSLDPGKEYTIAILLENAYGERKIITETASTASVSGSSRIDEFKKGVGLEDFVGSYLCDAGIGSSLSSTTDFTFRVDINRMDDSRVVLSGLGSTIDGFAPMVVAYFDATRNCLVVEPQNVGSFGGKYIQFALYTGTSYVYATGAFLLGWIDDKLVWVSDPAASYSFVGYTFMEFSSEKPSSSTYLKSILAGKVYTNPAMRVLEK